MSVSKSVNDTTQICIIVTSSDKFCLWGPRGRKNAIKESFIIGNLSLGDDLLSNWITYSLVIYQWVKVSEVHFYQSFNVNETFNTAEVLKFKYASLF